MSTEMFDERIALGLPTLAGYGLFDALRTTTELGFRSVMAFPGGPGPEHSIGRFPTLEFYEASDEHKEKVKAALSEFSHISIHQAWDSEWRIWIDSAHYFGAEIVTVHAGLRGKDEPLEKFCADRAEYLQSVGDYAQDKGVLVAVENEGGKYADYVEMIQGIEHPSVGATVDVGHCAWFERVRAITDIQERIEALNQIVCDLISALSSKVFHLHVHNVRAHDWRDHRSVPEGVIDFAALFAQLKRIGYSGLFDVELEEMERERSASATGRFLDSLCREILR